MDEPERLARTVERLDLNYCVITSVNRDDLPDGGAFMFAKCIQDIRRRLENCKIEVLIPDFQGFLPALRTVVKANPEVLNHNIETVRGVFHKVRPKGDYDQSLVLLSEVKNLNPSMVTKSGMMVGLGETKLEIQTTMKDLRSVGCDILTIGQYLRPSPRHFQLHRFYTPEEFDELRDIGMSFGFKNVTAGPLVRSSYRAAEQMTHALT
jgi:lipoic acid synthetase